MANPENQEENDIKILTDKVDVLVNRFELLLEALKGQRVYTRPKTIVERREPELDQAVFKAIKKGGKSDFISLKDAKYILGRIEGDFSFTSQAVNKAIQRVWKVKPRRSNSRTLYDCLLFVNPEHLDMHNSKSSQADIPQESISDTLPGLLNDIICLSTSDRHVSAPYTLELLQDVMKERSINMYVGIDLLEEYIQKLYPTAKMKRSRDGHAGFFGLTYINIA